MMGADSVISWTGANSPGYGDPLARSPQAVVLARTRLAVPLTGRRQQPWSTLMLRRLAPKYIVIGEHDLRCTVRACRRGSSRHRRQRIHVGLHTDDVKRARR